MKHEINAENVLILTANFSCTISMSKEEITIKKPSKEQIHIEQLIIDAEQQAYKETLAAYKSKSTFSNCICNIPGFEETFQQKLDNFIEPYGIIRVSEESQSLLPLVSPSTSSPIIYTSPNFSIINARGNCSSTSSIGNAVKDVNYLLKRSTTAFTGVAINENGISLNITTAFNAWNKATIKH